MTRMTLGPVCVFVLPLGLLLLALQTRHCGLRMGRPGTCSTSLQYISGSGSPHVALVRMSALLARLVRIAGKRPGGGGGGEGEDTEGNMIW